MAKYMRNITLKFKSNTSNNTLTCVEKQKMKIIPRNSDQIEHLF